MCSKPWAMDAIARVPATRSGKRATAESTELSTKTLSGYRRSTYRRRSTRSIELLVAPDVQAFVGSLLGVRSKQGVFITTCTFTADARAYADSLSDLRVILVDGPTLARLMINNGVGVAEQNRYLIMRLDSDYFEQ